MDNDLMVLTNTIFGEAAGADEKTKRMVGSTLINRLKSGRTAEFGENLPMIAMKGYYAVKEPNKPFKEALSGKFSSAESEMEYKRSMAIASGLLRGTIEPDKGMFYFKPDEEKKLKKTPKAFDFKKVRGVGKVGEYNVYDY